MDNSYYYDDYQDEEVLGPMPSEFYIVDSYFDDLLLKVDEKEEVEEEEEEEEEEDEEEEEEEEDDEDEWETDDEDEFDGLFASQEDITAKPSLPDVEGAIPKSILRKLPNSTLRKIIVHVKRHILMLETENYLYEKTIEKLESSEREIDGRVPLIADAEFEEHMRRARIMTCSSDSEPEPEDTGEYEPVQAVDEIHVSKDSFFENMSDNTKATAFDFFRNVGDMAPQNYDVMRHKYGDYVGTAAEKMDFTGEPGVKTRLNTKIFTTRLLLDEKMNTSGGAPVKPGGGKNSLDVKDSGSSGSLQEEEEEDFSGFNLSDAKKLSISDRLRFAQEEEEEFRKRFYQHETQALKDESSIQVYIDAHKHALAILMAIRKDFKLITKGASGVGMNGKLMADLLVKFRRKMRNQLSAEETKARITIRKVMAQKKRTMEQLKINKEAGRSISHIDFEYLLCESSILETEISGMNNTLQHLKDLTAQFHLVLQDERAMLEKMVVQEKTMNIELKRRYDLLHNFHDSFVKNRALIAQANVRMDEVKRKIVEYHAPHPIDYIRMKAKQYELEAEVKNLQHRLHDVAHSLINIQAHYKKYLKHLPDGRTTEEENNKWLEELKKEVDEKGLMACLEDDRDKDLEADLPQALSSKSLGIAKERQSTTMKSSTMRKSNVLMMPRRFDQSKALSRKNQVVVYDHDFDFDAVHN